MTPLAAGPLAILVDQSLLTGLVPDRVVEPMLTAVAPLAALIVAAVFAIAAATKLADQPSTIGDFTALGLPAPAVLARVVPPVELAITAAVLVAPAVGATLAALTLAGFTIVLAAALRAGRRVSCGCLGPLSREPISTATLGRNFGLILLTGVAAATPTSTGVLPTLPAGDVVLAVGPLVVLVAVGGQLLTLRAQLGRVWSVQLAGEAGPSRGRRSSAGDPSAPISTIESSTTHPSTDTGVTT